MTEEGNKLQTSVKTKTSFKLQVGVALMVLGATSSYALMVSNTFRATQWASTNSFSCLLNTANCFIDGKCYYSGVKNSANSCQYCDPKKSAKAWTSYSDGTACSLDSNGCTQEMCRAGTCIQGSKVTCDDINSCTSDSCSSTGNTTYRCANTTDAICEYGTRSYDGLLAYWPMDDFAQCMKQFSGSLTSGCNSRTTLRDVTSVAPVDFYIAIVDVWNDKVLHKDNILDGNWHNDTADQNGEWAVRSSNQGTGNGIWIDDNGITRFQEALEHSSAITAYDSHGKIFNGITQVNEFALEIWFSPSRNQTAPIFWMGNLNGSLANFRLSQDGTDLKFGFLTSNGSSLNEYTVFNNLQNSTIYHFITRWENGKLSVTTRSANGALAGYSYSIPNANLSSWSTGVDTNFNGSVEVSERFDIRLTNNWLGDIYQAAIYNRGGSINTIPLFEAGYFANDKDGDSYIYSGFSNDPNFAFDGDCDIGDNQTFPGAIEIADSKDNDCDGRIDEDVTSGCTINGVFYADRTINPNNTCQICWVATSQTSWTNRGDGTTCDDGNSSTVNDQCRSGVCSGSDDNNTCEINGIRYTNGTTNPSNQCQICNPNLSRTSWTNKSAGSLCNADSNGCTQNDTCTGTGVCLVGPVANCIDGLSCTIDTCISSIGPSDYACTHNVSAVSCLINGACYANGTINPANQCQICNPNVSTTSWANKSAGTACNADSNGCTQNDACNASGVCVAGPAATCNDGKFCTSDICVSTGNNTQVCSNPVSAGLCMIGGICFSFGAVNPSNQCQFCSPIFNPSAWSNRPPGTVCNADSNGCTQNDACDASGVCVAGPTATCNDGRFCTSDICVSTGNNTQVCSNPVSAGLCMIGGICFSFGAVNPSNQCQFCNPIFNPSAWSNRPLGTVCNADSNGCTQNDACNAGICLAGPPVRTCDDALTCTIDTCVSTSPSTYTCSYIPSSVSCLINGACYANGTINPANQCQICNPNFSKTSWTNRGNGAICSDGNPNTQNDQCQSGICVGV